MDVSRADSESRQIFGVYASGLTNAPGAGQRPRAQSVTEAGRARPPVRAGRNRPHSVEIRFRLIAEARRIRHLAPDGRSGLLAAVVRSAGRHIGRITEAGQGNAGLLSSCRSVTEAGAVRPAAQRRRNAGRITEAGRSRPGEQRWDDVSRVTEAGGIRPARRHRRCVAGVAETGRTSWHMRPPGRM